MPSVGTNALLAKVSGKINTKLIHCTASGLLATIPIIADSHEKAKVNNSKVLAIPSHSTKLAVGRKPTNSPTPIITDADMAFRARSDTVCPISRAEPIIGRDETINNTF